MLFQSSGSSLGISYGRASPKAVQVIAGQLVSKLRSGSRNWCGRIKQARIVVKDCFCCLFNIAVSKRSVVITAVYTKFQILCGIAPRFGEACCCQLQGVRVLNLTTYCWLNNAHPFSSANHSSQIQKYLH